MNAYAVTFVQLGRNGRSSQTVTMHVMGIDEQSVGPQVCFPGSFRELVSVTFLA